MGLILVIAIALYIWIAYFEIPNKAKIGEAIQQQVPLEGEER
ncbi:hypothetical protein QNH10_17030 [Sporosarcina thermotolerans]|nr:hypothetical protein [Sporosarcina thermotolerans]WHT47786.1 hypothetical protein QNH10_17030 [Sporosarcina thermotolerans]